jgi:hypothetical protein
VLLFLAAIISAFWYLRNEEIERETESVKRDTEITQQQIGLRLIQNQEALIRMARDLVARDIDIDEFIGQAAAFMRERPEITHLTWVDGRRRVRASQWAMLYPWRRRDAGPGLPRGRQPQPSPSPPSAPRATTRTPAYSRAFVDAAGGTGVPVARAPGRAGLFAGTLVAEYSVEALVRHFVPADVAQRHTLAVVDENAERAGRHGDRAARPEGSAAPPSSATRRSRLR